MLSKAEIRRYNRNSATGNETVYYLRFIPFCTSCIAGFTKEKKTPQKVLGKIYWWCDHIWQFQGCCRGCCIQKIRLSFSSSKRETSCYVVVRASGTFSSSQTYRPCNWWWKQIETGVGILPAQGKRKLQGLKAKLSSQQRVRCSDLTAIYLLANLSFWQAQIIETCSEIKAKVKHFLKAFWLLEEMLYNQKLEPW